MLKKDERKEGKRSAETSIPPTDNGPLVDKLNALNLNSPSSSASTSLSLPVKLETPAQTSLEDEFDLNDMDDPLAGFEAQRSGIKDLSLKVYFTSSHPLDYYTYWMCLFFELCCVHLLFFVWHTQSVGDALCVNGHSGPNTSSTAFRPTWP